ncbi:MAG: hypothetical protein CBC09_04520 [Cellvibrionales bacterium TMED49]|nr:MAG: hypothetical protein CBC09_04520 [Cellvibrionales bacterium TMED49]|tara:strand:+ start:3667 stop:4281 length:615 start_codon:yes stop_codon:yes gene_type:complete
MREKLIRDLKKNGLVRVTAPSVGHLQYAAVLLLLCDNGNNLEILLTKRSELVTHHRGEVAFPGGMWERCDTDMLETALRETNEEIGLSRDYIEPIATLPPIAPKNRPTKVTPFVARMIGNPDLTLQTSETDCVFRIPVNYFLYPKNYQHFFVNYGKHQKKVPMVQFHNYRIWGMTLRIIVNMLNSFGDANIKLNIIQDNFIDKR